MKVIVTTYRTANAKRVQIEVREESEAYEGGSLQEIYSGIHVDNMVKFRNSLLEKLSNKYEGVMAHPLPTIKA